MAKQNKPAIRFKGFTDAWEQRKLGEIATFINGRAYSQPELLSSGKYKVLRVGNFYTNDSWYYSDLELGEKYYADYGDLLYTWSATFGPHIWLGDRVIYHYHIWKINLSDQLEKQFAVQLLEQDRTNILSSKNGSTMVHITKEGMEQKDVIIPPSTKEQQEIGAFFLQLDNLITLHQRKYDKLQVLKKAMLEKMFPKNGSSVPEIRFKGFTDAWEQRKLGDCFTERCESMPDGELISVTINDGIKKFSELGRHDNSNDDKSKYKKVCAGDIAYNSMRMWQGASGYSPYEGIVSPAYTVLTPNSGINSKCMAYQFKLPATIHTFKINSQGITSDNWNLKFPALSEIEIYVSPYEQEQAKIAAYFANLDHLITLHQRELEKLQNIKKSMLEKMFV